MVTYMVGLKNGHMLKITPEVVNPRDIVGNAEEEEEEEEEEPLDLKKKRKKRRITAIQIRTNFLSRSMLMLMILPKLEKALRNTSSVTPWPCT